MPAVLTKRPFTSAFLTDIGRIITLLRKHGDPTGLIDPAIDLTWRPDNTVNLTQYVAFKTDLATLIMQDHIPDPDATRLQDLLDTLDTHLG